MGAKKKSRPIKNKKKTKKNEEKHDKTEKTLTLKEEEMIKK